MVGVSSPLAGDEGPIGSLEGIGVEQITSGVKSSTMTRLLLETNLGVSESGLGVKNDNRVRCLFPVGVPFLVLLVVGLSPFLGVLLSVGTLGMLVIIIAKVNNFLEGCLFVASGERVASAR